MRIVSWLRPVATGDRGFTMVTVILAMMVVSMLGAGAYAATVGDMPVARKDQDRKRAYEAAQAGVDWYLNQLRADPDWWRGCTHGGPTAANPLTQAPVDGAPSTSNVWQKVDDVAGTDLGDSQFRVELIRQNGQPCDLANPGTSKDASGTLWIRSTGASGGKVRSVLAGLKEQSAFLKYLYFSNWESMDPQFNNASAEWAPADGTGGNRNQCDYVRKVRDTESASYNWLGQIICVGNVFHAGDVLKGSVHTNDDSIQNCGAVFGRNADDVIEVANAPADPGAWLAREDGPRRDNPAPSYTGQEVNSLRCPSGSPSVATSLDSDHIKATIKAPGDNLQLPPSNIALKQHSPLLLKGQSCIEFIPSGVRVTKRGDHPDWGKDGQVDCSGASTDYSLPASGVIYVEGEGACTPRVGHNANTNYTSSPGCGDVAVKGTYPGSVTVGAENDIIITGNLERGTDGALLGLVANAYVRIYQPLTGNPYALFNQEGTSYLETVGYMDKRWPCKQAEDKDGGLYTGTGRMGKVPGYDAPHKIQAAIMSVNHTFVVDNGACEPLGDLEFEGAIASYWGTNLSFNMDLAAADCKTARAVQRRQNYNDQWWVHGIGWHSHADSPLGEYLVVWAGPSWTEFPNQAGYNGTFTPAGQTLCGALVDTGIRWKAGYTSRDWTYDERLRYDAPPHFIMPLNSDGRWVAGRRTEQVPTPVVPPTS